MPIKAFLAEVEAHLKQGNATEHTYRAALEKLFNAVLAPAKATNEPKHAAYGAPDFIIQRGNTPIGACRGEGYRHRNGYAIPGWPLV